MVPNNYIKIEKISQGRLDTLGLPVYEHVWILSQNVVFEEQVWFRGYKFNAAKYQHAVTMHSQASMFGSVRIKNGVSIRVNNQGPPPDMDSDIYYTEVIESRELSDLGKNRTTFKKYFISNYEVSEEEMQRVAGLVGCEL